MDIMSLFTQLFQMISQMAGSSSSGGSSGGTTSASNTLSNLMSNQSGNAFHASNLPPNVQQAGIQAFNQGTINGAAPKLS